MEKEKIHFEQKCNTPQNLLHADSGSDIKGVSQKPRVCLPHRNAAESGNMDGCTEPTGSLGRAVAGSGKLWCQVGGKSACLVYSRSRKHEGPGRAEKRPLRYKEKSPHTEKRKKTIEPSQGIKKKRFFKACLCLSLFFPLSLSFLCSPRPRWEKRLELHHLGPLTPSFVPRMKSRLLPPLRLTISSPWQQQSLQSQGGPCYRGRQARKKVHSLFEKSYLSDSKQDAG